MATRPSIIKGEHRNFPTVTLQMPDASVSIGNYLAQYFEFPNALVSESDCCEQKGILESIIVTQSLPSDSTAQIVEKQFELWLFSNYSNDLFPNTPLEVNTLSAFHQNYDSESLRTLCLFKNAVGDWKLRGNKYAIIQKDLPYKPILYNTEPVRSSKIYGLLIQSEDVATWTPQHRIRIQLNILML